MVKNPRGKALVWNHFGLKKNSDGTIEQNVAICRACEYVVKCAGGGTSNLTAHMRRHHPSIGCETKVESKQVEVVDLDVIGGIKRQTGSTQTQYTISNMFKKTIKYNPKSAKARAITEKMARFIVKDLRPYRIVESKEFKDVVQALDPQYSLPSRKQFAEVVVPQLYNEVKDDVKRSLVKASQVYNIFSSVT